MHEGIPDTAATKHYITEDQLPICKEVDNTIGPGVTVVKGRVMTPTKKSILPLPKEFARNARIAYSFNNLKSEPLISIGQLCDDDYTAIFKKYDVKVMKNNKILIEGRRTDNGLWNLPIGQEHSVSIQLSTTTKSAHVANGVIQTDSTKMS